MVIIPYIEKSVKGLITYWLDWEEEGMSESLRVLVGSCNLRTVSNRCEKGSKWPVVRFIC